MKRQPGRPAGSAPRKPGVENDRSPLANNLLAIRHSQGLTQAQMANLLGIQQKLYGAYEEGRAEPPIARFLDICERFNISNVWEFYGWNARARPASPGSEGMMTAWLEMERERAGLKNG